MRYGVGSPPACSLALLVRRVWLSLAWMPGQVQLRFSVQSLQVGVGRLARGRAAKTGERNR